MDSVYVDEFGSGHQTLNLCSRGAGDLDDREIVPPFKGCIEVLGHFMVMLCTFDRDQSAGKILKCRMSGFRLFK